MKVLKILLSWLIDFWKFISKRKNQSIAQFEDKPFYSIASVEDLPDVITDSWVYIIQEGIRPELLAFKCPCGCKENILLNLLTDTSPQWHFTINDKGIINVSPSIWRTVGCRSHFWIIDGNVKWV